MKTHGHKFIILESLLVNREDIYYIKVRNTNSFFRVTLSEMLSDTHLLFNLPSLQSCSIAIDAFDEISRGSDIHHKIELAQKKAWRVVDFNEYRGYSLILSGYGEKSEISFQLENHQERSKRCALHVIKSNTITQFNPPSAFIIGCVAALATRKVKKFPLRLIGKNKSP